MSATTCPANSFQGLPISFRGELKRDNFEVTYADIVRDIQLRTALSIRSTPRKFLDKDHGFIEDNANDTLFINRIPYTLQTIQFCRHWATATTPITVQPESDSPAEAFAQVVFAFKKAYNDYGGEPVYLVIVPISNTQDTQRYDTDIDSYFSDILNQTVPRVKSLEPFFRGKTLRLGYQSCVELQNPGDGAISTLHVGVILCPGVYVKTATVEDLKKYFSSRVPEFILPAFAHPGLNTAEAKPDTTVSRWSSVGKTYTQSRDLSTKQFFVFNVEIIPNAPTPTAAKVDENGLRTTQQYKCVPLDRLKDISGNLVLLDPATGARTLADTLSDEAEAQGLELKDVMAAKPDDGTFKEMLYRFAKYIVAILAIVIGGAVWFFIYSRGKTTTPALLGEKLGITPTVLANNAAAAAAVASVAASTIRQNTTPARNTAAPNTPAATSTAAPTAAPIPPPAAPTAVPTAAPIPPPAQNPQ